MASSGGKALCNHSLIHSSKHPPKRSVLLKDYLRDELSSCSSNGFKSLPRRQCCTSVGFFVEKDPERKRRNTRFTSSSSTMFALQRASGAVIKAIKWLPLSQKSGKAGLLSRSFSRKLLSGSFWRKAAREEGSEGVPRRRRSFRELIMEDQEHHKATSFDEDAHAASITTSSGCGSDSWGDSEFTFASTAASSESSNENYLPQFTKEDAPHHKVEQVVTKEYWSNEKEQFSPVSILDCPFEDEEEKSHFSSTSTFLSFIQGAKAKHMQKRRHFESVAPLEPVVLEKRFTRLELEDEPRKHYKKQCSPASMRTQNGNSRDKSHNIEENARDLLNLVKSSIQSNCLIIKTENLLFDYFKQSIGENKDIDDDSKKLHLCKVAEDWIHGQPQEVYLDWEVQGGRCVYVREMDKYGEWKNFDQEIHQLALELANEVLANLVNDFLLDLLTTLT